MLLHHCTWPEVEARLKESRGVIVPIGSTEQHGPNGLIGTDALCAEVVARGVGEAADALVAPTVSVGMAQHHLGFPGSMTLRPSTLIAVLRDMVQSLVRHGFERVFFINGHGGNIATVGAAFSEIYAETSLDPAVSHATPSEVALTQYAFPETIKRAEMSPRIAPRGAFHDALDYRARFPDGRIGSDPSLATPDAGRRLYEAAVADLSEDYRAFVAS